jgi:hypothetical protein
MRHGAALPGRERHSRLNEMVLVSHRVQVKPLVPLVTDDSTFVLLALSQNQVRLSEATRDTARRDRP